MRVKIRGEPIRRIPDDLYIPPDALEVVLEAFEGPLDLLLYLIKRQNIDILDISIAEVTRQYLEYIALMQELRLERAAEYLLMAAWLAEIKSRLLLPRPLLTEDEEPDPRAELVRRLQEYERIRLAAGALDTLARLERDFMPAAIATDEKNRWRPQPEVGLRELLNTMRAVSERARLTDHHTIKRESLSVRTRMSHILEYLEEKQEFVFSALLDKQEDRQGIVVTLLALLELLKTGLVELEQNALYEPIHVYRCTRQASVQDGTSAN